MQVEKDRGHEHSNADGHLGTITRRLVILSRVAGLFFQPGEVFKLVAGNPRWFAAFLLFVIFTLTPLVVHKIRVPYRIRAEAQLELAMQKASGFVSDEALRAIRQQLEERAREGETFESYVTEGIGIFISVLLVSVLVALAYWLGGLYAGTQMTFGQALALRFYSLLPPTVTASVLSVGLMYWKSPDEIDPVNPYGALVSNLGTLFDSHVNPFLFTLGQALDFFQIWGLILAIIGLATIPEKMTRKMATAIVLTVWFLGLGVQFGAVLLFGIW